MKYFANAATVSLLALGATLALTADAKAGCTPGVSSDSAKNTCVGSEALFHNSINSFNNTAYGAYSLWANTTGQYNTASGAVAL